MELKRIKAAELVEFADTQVAIAGAVLPITPQRAKSQVENPAVNPDDILLIVSLDGQKNILGYIGLLPAACPSGGERIFWNSCWWVAENAGAMVSLSLFSEFIKSAENRVVFSDMSEKSVSVVKGLGAFIIDERKGAVIRFRSALSRRLETKKDKGLVQKIISASRLLSIVDGLINLPGNTAVRKFCTRNTEQGNVRLIQQLCNAHTDFIRRHHNSGITVPSKELFKWWTDFPWLVKPDQESERQAKSYYFSSLAKKYMLFCLEVSNNSELIGLAICSVRDGLAKTHYLHYLDHKKEIFFQLLYADLLEDKSHHTLISFHPEFVAFIKGNSLPMRQIHWKTRYAGYGKALKDELGGLVFQDGDGDYIFT